MKKIVSLVLGVMLLVAVSAQADSYTYSLTSAANSTNTSDAIPISGWLDKVELSINGTATTQTMLIATFDGTVAVDVIVTNAVTSKKVVRPRVQPTDNTGTVIPAVESSGGTNATTVLNVVYDKILAGGNIKVRTVNDSTIASTNKVVFYYEPLKR